MVELRRLEKRRFYSNVSGPTGKRLGKRESVERLNELLCSRFQIDCQSVPEAWMEQVNPDQQLLQELLFLSGPVFERRQIRATSDGEMVAKNPGDIKRVAFTPRIGRR